MNTLATTRAARTGSRAHAGILLAEALRRLHRTPGRAARVYRAMDEQHHQSEHGTAARADDLTQLIEQARDGHSDARKTLFSQVYDELRTIAAACMRDERPGHTLGATALVNESYLRLFGVRAGAHDMSFEHRHAFFKAAAVAMRRILIDHARARAAAKRSPGKHARVISLDIEHAAEQADPEDLIALDEALDALAREDERAAAVVHLRFYAGRQIDEIARMLQLSDRTVKRDWEYARARLQQLLDQHATSSEHTP